MACSCHTKNKDIDNHSASPYDQCLICALKHFSAAYIEAKLFGYIDINRSSIIGDLLCATRHTQDKYKDLADSFRQLRHNVQQRTLAFVLSNWQQIYFKLNLKIRLLSVKSTKGTIYVFSNVDYPKLNRISASSNDLLVFLNKARNIDYYKEYSNKIIFHRALLLSYGKPLDCASNYYVFGATNNIPPQFIKNLKKEYDWDYLILLGKTKCMTTGYMVVKYLQSKFPDNKIVLVNFGYKVLKSTYRCPWHNWKFLAEVLDSFKHLYTEKLCPMLKKSILIHTATGTELNKACILVVTKLHETGKVNINISTNIPVLWRDITFLDNSITNDNAYLTVDQALFKNSTILDMLNSIKIKIGI